MRERGYWIVALVFAAFVVAGGLWAAAGRDSGGGAALPANPPPATGEGSEEGGQASEEPSLPGDDPSLFTRSLFADGLDQPTALAFGPDGSLYVAELTGRIVVLSDEDGDGRADGRRVFASGLESPLGLAVLRPNDVVVSQRGRITRLRDTDGDGAADRATDLVTGLPTGRHQNDSIVVGLDGRLYWGQGSRSDHGEGGVLNLEASILSANVDGSDLRVVASGLRNPYGLAFDAATGRLFATDNGRDSPENVPDELNLIQQDGDYGWPECWGDGGGRGCEGTKAPIALLPDHSSADGIAVYRGANFPKAYDGAVFVALWGANSGAEDIGRRVVAVLPPKTEGGPWRPTDFASGFEHPLAVAVDARGLLYVADMGTGSITRFSAAEGSR